MKKLHIAWLCSLLLLLLYPLEGKAAGLDPHTTERIEAEIMKNMELHHIPGMAFVLADQTGVVYARGFGHLQHQDQALVNEQTNFKIGSISKVFAAVAVMQLHEQGLIDIQDPIKQYLPWFSTKDQASSDQITIAHLLTHTSGLPDRLNAHDITSMDIEKIQEALQEKLRHIELVHEPGQSIEYTNMNMDLLQVLVEVVTGKSFPDYMEAHLFHPLGMQRTGYYDMGEDLPNSAIGHRTHWGKLKPYDDRFVYASFASSGLSTNARDLGSFIAFLLNEGQTHPGLIGSDHLRAMRVVRAYYPDDSVGYGYGWLITPRTLEHAGGRPGYTANIILSSDLTYGFALLANSKQNITDETNYNIYSILNGEEPRELRVENHPKISSEATFVLSFTLVIFVLLLCIIGFISYRLARDRMVFAIRKPGMVRAVLWLLCSLVYGFVLYVIHIYLPRSIIGVPALPDFRMDPDLIQSLYMFTIVATGFYVTMSVYILLIRKAIGEKISL